jgi:hypothetical protein
LDTEWLLSTLFDASLLSTLKAADPFGGSFFGLLPDRGGNHKSGCCWTPTLHPRNDLFIITRAHEDAGIWRKSVV